MVIAYSGYELLATLIVACGIALQTWIGIGFGLVAAPVLYLLNPAYVPGPVLILGFSLSLLIVLKESHQLQWRRIFPAIAARLPGSWVGALLLVSIPQYSLSLLFGGALLFAVLLTWRTWKLQTTVVSLSIGGFFSGLIGTATSVGGPPIALVYQESDRITARNEIAAFFLIGTPISLAMLMLEGRFDLDSFWLAIKLLPGVLLGFVVARYLDPYIGRNSIKPAVLIVSLVSALAVLHRGIMGWLHA